MHKSFSWFIFIKWIILNLFLLLSLILYLYRKFKEKISLAFAINYDKKIITL